MDTTAYLTRQGWLGAGHSLQPDGRGIKKPLLVSKKPNVLGLGRKQHDSHADQWWARAFDSSLRNLAVDTLRATGAHHVAIEGSGALEMVQHGGGKWVGKAGLYGSFVRGEGLSGTLTPGDRGKEATNAPEGGLKGNKRQFQEEDGNGERDGAVLLRKRRKDRKLSIVHGSILDAGRVSDKDKNTTAGSKSSKEDRSNGRKAGREAAERGAVQFAVAAGGSAASPAGGTRKQKRRERDQVAETKSGPPRGNPEAAMEVRKENEDAEPPMVTIPNTALDRTEKKRRKEERRGCRSNRRHSDRPDPSQPKGKGKGKDKGKRKAEREDE